MNRDWIATARTLSEALPYLQRYDGAIVVIKLGGHAMGSDAAMEPTSPSTLMERGEARGSLSPGLGAKQPR